MYIENGIAYAGERKQTAKIRSIKLLKDYSFIAIFENNEVIRYDLKKDIETLPYYSDLKSINGLWEQGKLDESGTYIYWNDNIDLPSDVIYECGEKVTKSDINKFIPRYQLIIYWSNKDNRYICEVPELPGCMADGKTYHEALKNIEIIIQEWLETAQLIGREIPTPRGKLAYA